MTEEHATQTSAQHDNADLFAQVLHLPMLMTVKQAAAFLDWSPRTYYDRAIRGQVPSHMVGHRRFVRKTDFLRWLGVIPE